MAAYEILLMLDPEVEDDRQTEIVTRVREMVEGGGGGWRTHDAWGRRKLAYEIGHKTDAHYHLVVFDAEPATLDEVSRVLKITDGVMRHGAFKHIEGSRTSAPREEEAPPPRERPSRGDDDRGRSSYAGSSPRPERQEEE